MSAGNGSTHSRFAALLSGREMELRAILSATSQAADETSGAGEVSDFKDLAALESQSEIDGVRVAQAARELSLVLAAQMRLTDGRYGLCLDCGQAIGEDRLIAMPAAPFCAPCQATYEHPPHFRP